MLLNEKDFIKNDKRKLYAYICDNKHCGKKSYKRKDILLKQDNHFCSKKCYHQNQTTSAKTPCLHCGELVLKCKGHFLKKRNSFCSLSCSISYNNTITKCGVKHHYWKGGRGSYRGRALRELPHVCVNPNCLPSKFCKKIPTKMLDVDHKDNDRSNNSIGNLQILCIWCHALKTRKVTI